MSLDVTPLTNAFMQLFAGILLGVGTWAITRVMQWLNLKQAAQATANLDDILQKGVTYGLQQTQELIRQHGWDSIEVRNAALGHASTYVISRFPDTLKAVGLNLSDQSTVTKIVTDALDRAFPHAAAMAAASPATPPITAPNPPRTAELAGQPNVTTALVEEAKS